MLSVIGPVTEKMKNSLLDRKTETAIYLGERFDYLVGHTFLTVTKGIDPRFNNEERYLIELMVFNREEEIGQTCFAGSLANDKEIKALFDLLKKSLQEKGKITRPDEINEIFKKLDEVILEGKKNSMPKK